MVENGDLLYCESFAQDVSLDPDRERFFECVRFFKEENARGLHLLTDMANDGSILAMAFVGDIYTFGYNDICNLDLGMEFLQRAARGGSIEGAYQLARAYRAIGRIDDAIAQFEHLVENQKFTPAMFNLAGIYYHNTNIPNNGVTSKKFYEMGASFGHVLSGKNIAIQMIKGEYGFINRFKGLARWRRQFMPSMRVILRHPESDLLRGSIPRLRVQEFRKPSE